MKRFVSLLIIVLTICAICVPVSASEASASEHYNKAQSYTSENHYFDAAKEYKTAAKEYYEAQNFEKAAEAFSYAGVNYDRVAGSKDPGMYAEVYGTFFPTAMKSDKIREFYYDAGYAFRNAQILYSRSGQEEAATRMEKYIANICKKLELASDYFDSDEVLLSDGSLGSGSVLSEGNIWIIVGIVAAVVVAGGVWTLVIVKKKKNSAQCDS